MVKLPKVEVRPKGGRCRRMPYKTVMIRVPVPLQEEVQKMVQDFRVKAQVEDWYEKNEKRLTPERRQELLAVIDAAIDKLEPAQKAEVLEELKRVAADCQPRTE